MSPKMVMEEGTENFLLTLCLFIHIQRPRAEMSACLISFELRPPWHSHPSLDLGSKYEASIWRFFVTQLDVGALKFILRGFYSDEMRAKPV